MYLKKREFLPILLLGLSSGFLNGLLGAGGGILLVFGLRGLLRGRVRDARSFYASTIAVMLPLSAISAWQYRAQGYLPSLSLKALVLPAVLGGAVGALLLRCLKPRLLARIFAAVVLVSGILLVV